MDLAAAQFRVTDWPLCRWVGASVAVSVAWSFTVVTVSRDATPRIRLQNKGKPPRQRNRSNGSCKEGAITTDDATQMHAEDATEATHDV